METLRPLNLRIIITAAMLAASFLLFMPRTAHAGLSENVFEWAWSGSIGWISMNCVNTGTCGAVDYGVTFVDVEGQIGWAHLMGWAWSETVGWICFGQSCSGTTPEGGAPYAQYRDEYNSKIDELYGWAKIDALGDDGWISLNCENLNECMISNYHTVLDPLTGEFEKGNFNDHWAWGGTDDVRGAGWIDFSPVRTTWVLARLGKIARPEGVYEPDNTGLRGTHLSQMNIGFTQFSASGNSLLECEMEKSDGTFEILQSIIPTAVRNGTAALQYTVQNSDSTVPGQLWTINSCRIGSPPTLTACASDANCNAFQFCDETSGFCRIKLREKIRKWPIFTHDNTWSGLDSEEDQYKALRCHSGFPGNYFNNAANCDFSGDASFSLLMRRGVPLEGDCHNGIDDDGNGEIDCADRHCQGISYRCQTLPRTSCIWGATGDGIMDCTDTGYEAGMLCCSKQPRSESESIHNVVNGLECTYGDPKDGYFDCDCTNSTRYNESPSDDCFSPGYSSGDLCCNENNDVTVQ